MSFISIVANFLEPLAYGTCCLFIFYYTRQSKKVKWRVIAVYYFLATVLMIRAAYASSNIEIYNLLCLLTHTCLGAYFYYSLNTRLKKRIVLVLCVVDAGYYITSNLLFPSHAMFDSTGYVILSIGIVLMAFMFMHQILTNITEDPLSLNFDFWFVSSQLIYHLGAFAIFLTYQYLTKKILPADLYSFENRTLLMQVWGVHNVLLFLSSIITSAAVLWISFRRKSLSS